MTDDLRQEWGTPRAVFDALHREHQFTIDVCASLLNHKLPAYLTKADDALSCSWKGERVWCNPPYEAIDPWLEHAAEAELAYFLLPARTFNPWWEKWARIAQKQWFIGRMRFEPPEGIKPSSVPFPIVGLLFQPRGQNFLIDTDVYRDARTGKILDTK